MGDTQDRAVPVSGDAGGEMPPNVRRAVGLMWIAGGLALFATLAGSVWLGWWLSTEVLPPWVPQVSMTVSIAGGICGLAMKGIQSVLGKVTGKA